MTDKKCSNCRHFSEEYTGEDDADAVAEVGNCGSPDGTHIWVKPDFVCRKHDDICPGCGQTLGGEAAGDTVLGKCLACANERAAMAVEGELKPGDALA